MRQLSIVTGRVRAETPCRLNTEKRMPWRLAIIPTNSTCGAHQVDLGRLTEKPLVRKWVRTASRSWICSSKVGLATGISSNQFSKPHWLMSLTIKPTGLAKAAGSYLRPKPARLASHRRPLASRNAVLWLAIFDFKLEEARHEISGGERAPITKAIKDALDISEITTVGGQAFIEPAMVLTETKGVVLLFD